MASGDGRATIARVQVLTINMCYRRLYSQGLRMFPRNNSFSHSFSVFGFRGTFLNSNNAKCVFRSSWPP